MSVRVPVLVAALVALLPASAAAQPPPPLDTEGNVPYLWRVVVQTRPHPLLTPSFRDQLRRDLLAALQPGLGQLGTVEVVDLDAIPRDKWDPLWQQFDDKGFGALDAPRDLTGVKTHFLRVEVRDGIFYLEARQYDGFTGLASPTVRKQSTRVAESVGRVAGLMIERDFGIAGTADPAGKDEYLIKLKAGQLGPVDRLVKPGDVFAVQRVMRTTRPAPEPARTATGRVISAPTGSTPPPAYSPEPLKWTLLRVVEVKDGGVARCTALTGYKVPLTPKAGTAGFRCLRLPTVAAPVAVRLVSGNGSSPGAGTNIRVWGTDTVFADKPTPRDYLDLDPQTLMYRSNRPLTNVACLTVSFGPTASKQFPVPILGPEPITLPVEVSAELEEKATYERAVLSLSARTSDARIAQVACFDAVAKLIKDRKNAEAVARAKAGFQAAETAHKVLTEELDQLRKDVAKSPGTANLLTAVESQLAALQASNAQLGARLTELEAVVVKENDPKEVARDVQAQALNTRITLLLQRGEVDEALAAYDQLATLVGDNQRAEVKTRRDKLAAEWKPKDDEHARARLYLTQTWPSLSAAADLNDSLGTLRTAVDRCKQHGDKYAFRKLLTALGGIPAKLTDLTKDLDPNNDADRKVFDDVKKVRDFVTKLEPELIEFLKANP
jgi:hypothetical protein